MEDVTHKKKKEVMVTIRTSQSIRDWLKKRNINYSSLFHEAVKQLKKKEKKK